MRRMAPILLLLSSVACIPQPRGADEGARMPTAVDGARTGGTLRVAITPPDGIDPNGAHEPAGELIARTMCDQLIALDPVTGDPRPSLASSWTVGNRGKSLFVRLRPGIRFSDGTPLTAEDVRFTLSRLANERFASPSASLLEPIAGYGFTHGEVETDDEHLRRSLVGVQIVDTRTVSIALTDARASFFRALSHPATSPVPKRAVEEDPGAFARAPVCAGPYALRGEPRPGGPIELERVRSYRGVNPSLTRRGAGYADRITFTIHPSRAEAAAAFRAGRADLAPLPEDDTAPAPDGASIELLPSLQHEYIGLPTTDAPFDDARVRAALSLALDRTAISRDVYGARRTPLDRFLPAVIEGSAPQACARNAPARADVNAARALLRTAGVDADDISTTLSFNDEFANRALATAVARQWRAALGMRVTLAPMPWARFETLASRPQGLDGPFRFGWAPAYPAAERVVAPLFTVNGIGRDNWSLYSSRDLNDALRQMNEADDGIERARQVRRAHEILCDDMPMLPLLRSHRPYMLRDTVRSASGPVGDAASGQPLLRELFLVRGS